MSHSFENRTANTPRDCARWMDGHVYDYTRAFSDYRDFRRCGMHRLF